MIRTNFIELRRFSTSKYRNAIVLAQNILNKERWDLLPHVWDATYKGKTAEWLDQFNKLNHCQLSSVWPQVHLIEQISNHEKDLLPYRESLHEYQCDHLCVSDPSSPHSISSPPLIQEYSRSPRLPVPALFEKASEFYSFLARHQHLLSIDGSLNIEAAYRTTSEALAVHPAVLNKILREKVALVKSMLMRFRPISSTLMHEVTNLAIMRPPAPVNPSFYRFMHRKRAKELKTISPAARAVLRSKKYVPTPHDFSRHMRAYLSKQVFELDDGSLTVSWTQSLYCNQTSMWDAVQNKTSDDDMT